MTKRNKCPEGGEHEYSPDLEYDCTGTTINCEKCGEPPPPLTPRMKVALKLLVAGKNLALDEDSPVGRPTKQRLAKYGLAEYVTPKDWDGPMRITEAGRQAL